MCACDFEEVVLLYTFVFMLAYICALPWYKSRWGNDRVIMPTTLHARDDVVVFYLKGRMRERGKKIEGVESPEPE